MNQDFLKEDNFDPSIDGYLVAARNGDLNTIKELRSKSSQSLDVPDAMDLAASNGHLEVVKYLHENKQSCSKKAIDEAASSGHLDVIKFLHENRTEGCTTQAIVNAIEHQQEETAKFLNENFIECDEESVKKFGLAHNNINAIRWFQSENEQPTPLTKQDLETNQ